MLRSLLLSLHLLLLPGKRTVNDNWGVAFQTFYLYKQQVIPLDRKLLSLPFLPRYRGKQSVQIRDLAHSYSSLLPSRRSVLLLSLNYVGFLMMAQIHLFAVESLLKKLQILP